MRLGLLTLAAISLLAPSAHAKLQLQDIRAAYGRLGPVRKSLEYFPHDEVVFRYLISGAKTDERGSVDCEITVETTGPDGSALPRQTFVAQGMLSFGGGSFPAAARVEIPDDTKPGVYVLKVGVLDRLGKDQAGFQRTIKVNPTRFAIVAQHFTYDVEGNVDAPAGGHTDQTLYLWMRVIGFDRSRHRIDTEMNIRVVDAQGKELMPNPIRVKGTVTDPAVVNEASYVSFKGELYLNHAGRFTLSVTIIDWVSKDKLKFETPIEITAPAG